MFENRFSISYWKVSSNTLDSIGIPIPFQRIGIKIPKISGIGIQVIEIGMELELKFENSVEL